jgi:two-component sensor histidine kinase
MSSAAWSAAQELERKRLARELHDETGQALTSILLGLKPLEQAVAGEDGRAAVASLRQLVVSTLRDVRRLAVELRPSALDDFGLVPALERLVDTFSEQTEIRVDLETNLGEERLPSEVETAIYRIVQEALSNVVKHAGASRISILLTRKNGSVAAVIEDDGLGFDPASVSEEGLGLVGMRERVGLVGGRLRISACTPATPREKGAVEAGVRYLKSGFWPARRFASLPELDGQYGDWRDRVCNSRVHVSGRFSVAERLAEERGALRPLAPARFDWSGQRTVRVPLDGYLRHGRCFYRAPERLVHERVELRFDRDQVWICHRGREVARYERSYEQGLWLPPPIMRAEPPLAPPPLALPRLEVAPPELADYAELCA